MLAEAGTALLGADLGAWVSALLVALIAGYVQGFTGMGFAVVATPLFVVAFGEPRQAVMLSLLLSSALRTGVILETRRALSLPRASLLVAGAVVGTPAGSVILIWANPRVLIILIATTALMAAAVGLIRLPPPLRNERAALGISGVVGGFLNGATSIGGPVPALFASMQRWDVGEGRATLALFNLASCVVGLAAMVTENDIEFLVRGLWLVPGAAIGAVFGAVSVRRVSAHVFRYALLVTVGVAGLLSLASAVGR
jgi:uncharacterized membrane protein YfcA